MSTIQTFFFVADAERKLRGIDCPRVCGPGGSWNLVAEWRVFPASEYESVGIEPLLFQNLCLEARGDPGGRKLFIFPPAAASAHILIETDAVARLYIELIRYRM